MQGRLGVVDLQRGVGQAVAVVQDPFQIQPDAVIVILTRYGDDAYLQELLRAGADGYVLKQSAASELLQAIRATAARNQYLDSALTARVTAGFLAADRHQRRRRGR